MLFGLLFTPLLQHQKTNGRPFQSPLLEMILRGYLIEGKPKQDKLLVAHLKQERCIPLPLIAMVTVLVGSVFLSSLPFLIV